MAFENVGENLSKKMGPFPVWVWGVLIGGAFVLWYWVSQRDLGSGESPASEDNGTVPAPSGDFSTVPVMPPADGVQDENTNLEWSIQALNSVTGTGTSLLAAQTAISKYLNGERLSTAEQVIINKVLEKIGAPPEGVTTPDLQPSTSTEVNWNTTTSIGARTVSRFGRTVVVNTATRWVSDKGHTSPPQGTVEISLDGGMTTRTPTINGRAVRPVVLGRNVKAFEDKVTVVTARFIPKTGGKAKPSSASPHTIRIS